MRLKLTIKAGMQTVAEIPPRDGFDGGNVRVGDIIQLEHLSERVTGYRFHISADDEQTQRVVSDTVGSHSGPTGDVL